MASSADKAFQRALASLKGGQLDEAERSFKKLLNAQPKHAPGLNLFAILLTQLGRFEEADRYLRRALSENAKSDITFYNHGVVLCALKKPVEAIEQFTKALVLNPSAAETWNSRGAARKQLRQFDEAIADFDKAISQNAKYSDAYCNKGASLGSLQLWERSLAAYDGALALNSENTAACFGRGLALFHLNRRADALDAFDKAIKMNPNFAGAWLGRGNTLVGFKRYEDAAAAYDKALALQPRLVDAWIGGGNIFCALKNYDKALAAYDQALELNPNLAAAWVGRGNALGDSKRYDEALAAYNKALELEPDLVSAWVGRGNVFSLIGFDDEALAAYDKAIALRPDVANAWSGRGGVFMRLNRDDDALRCYEKATAIDPEFAEPHFQNALIKLAHGNFKDGWPLYEWRWKTTIRMFSARNFPQKLWLGDEDIAGKTILVHSEQGFGDIIHFSRYLQKLKSLNCQIIFEVPAALYALFAAQKHNFLIVTAGERIPDFDVHCPLMSLPLAFGTTLETVPAAISYLTAPHEKIEFWRSKLGKRNKPRIGLCWSGSPHSIGDPWRNIPLELLLPLLKEKAEWHSIQKDVRVRDRAALDSSPHIIDHAQALSDFTDTAALICELDLVISVDAVAANLSGAMGKPVWTLLSFHPDFRWLRDREDSPWYPTVKVFRQRLNRDWGNVIDRLRTELDAFLG